MLTSSQLHELMHAALVEAQRGMDAGEVPIGCVLARGDGKHVTIVARGFNRVNSLQRKTAHAEMVAFENACAQHPGCTPALPLDAKDAILISTLEPCVMCLGAAMEAGVRTVVYGLAAPADNGTRRVKPPESPESTAPTIIGPILPGASRALFVTWLQTNESTEQAKFVKQLLALTED
jgi:tRNA(adenine34) deaminase